MSVSKVKAKPGPQAIQYTKICETCLGEFNRNKGEDLKAYKVRRYCGPTCRAIGRKENPVEGKPAGADPSCPECCYRYNDEWEGPCTDCDAGSCYKPDPKVAL